MNYIMRFRFYLLILGLLGSIASRNCMAQASYDVQHFGSTNFVNDFIATEDLIYIATDYGLDVRSWDYTLVKHYDVSNGLMGNTVKKLQLVDGKLYCGQWGKGVSIIENGNISNIERSTVSHYFFVDSQDRIWSSSWALEVLDNGTWTEYVDKPIDQGVDFFFEDTQKNIWIASDHGVTKYKDGNWERFDFREMELDVLLTSDMLEDTEGNIYLSSWRGIVKYDGNNWTSIYKGNVLEMTFDADGKIWGACYGDGAICISQGEVVKYNNGNGLNVSPVLNVQKDRSDNIWFSGREKAAKYNGGNFVDFKPFGMLADVDLRSFIMVGDSICARTAGFGAGISVFDGINWTEYKNENTLPGKSTHNVIGDHEGNIWLTCLGGLSKYNGTIFQNFNNVNSDFNSTFAKGLCVEKNGALLIGSFKNGIFRYKDGVFTSLKGPMGNTSAIHQQASGKVFVASDFQGVSSYSEGEWKKYENLGNYCIPAFIDKGENDLWINCEPKKWARYDSSLDEWVLKDTIIDICTDQKGTKWTYDAGLLAYKRENEDWTFVNQSDNVRNMFKARNGVVYAVGAAHPFGLVTCLDGEFHTDMISECIYSAFEMPNGDIWAGGQEGAYKATRQNQKPVFTNDPIREITVNTAYEYTVGISDADNDILSTMVNEIPEWLECKTLENGALKFSGTPSELGVYEVKISLSDGYETVIQEFEIKVGVYTGIEELETKSELIVYPVPATDRISVELTDFDSNSVLVQLISLDGKIVFYKNVTNTLRNFKYLMNVSNFDRGVYIIAIQNGKGERITKRIVLQ